MVGHVNFYYCYSTLRRKYEYLFLLMVIAVLLQLYMEYKFYMINQTELNKLHQLVESKLNLKDIGNSIGRRNSEEQNAVIMNLLKLTYFYFISVFDKTENLLFTIMINIFLTNDEKLNI